MIDEQEVLTKITSVSAVQLRIWITKEWVRPAQSGAAIVFGEADLARIRLLDMLDNQLGVGSEAIPIILSLIDQVHDLREQTRIISRAIDAQPADIRSKILQAALEND